MLKNLYREIKGFVNCCIMEFLKYIFWKCEVKAMNCPKCNGEGRIYNQDWDNEFERVFPNAPSGDIACRMADRKYKKYIVCQDCNGTGTIDEGDNTFICPQCGQEVFERFRSCNNPSICVTCDRGNED